MNEDEATEKLKQLVARCKECKFATCENCEINWNEVKAIETILDLYKQEKEKNRELFEEYNKRVNTIIKYEQGIKEFIDEIHITDIEPWSIYKINGGLLFNLEQLLEEE